MENQIKNFNKGKMIWYCGTELRDDFQVEVNTGLAIYKVDGFEKKKN